MPAAHQTGGTINVFDLASHQLHVAEGIEDLRNEAQGIKVDKLKKTFGLLAEQRQKLLEAEKAQLAQQQDDHKKRHRVKKLVRRFCHILLARLGRAPEALGQEDSASDTEAAGEHETDSTHDYGQPAQAQPEQSSALVLSSLLEPPTTLEQPLDTQGELDAFTAPLLDGRLSGEPVQETAEQELQAGAAAGAMEGSVALAETPKVQEGTAARRIAEPSSVYHSAAVTEREEEEEPRDGASAAGGRHAHTQGVMLTDMPKLHCMAALQAVQPTRCSSPTFKDSRQRTPRSQQREVVRSAACGVSVWQSDDTPPEISVRRFQLTQTSGSRGGASSALATAAADNLEYSELDYSSGTDEDSPGWSMEAGVLCSQMGMARVSHSRQSGYSPAPARLRTGAAGPRPQRSAAGARHVGAGLQGQSIMERPGTQSSRPSTVPSSGASVLQSVRKSSPCAWGWESSSAALEKLVLFGAAASPRSNGSSSPGTPNRPGSVSAPNSSHVIRKRSGHLDTNTDSGNDSDAVTRVVSARRPGCSKPARSQRSTTELAGHTEDEARSAVLQQLMRSVALDREAVRDGHVSRGSAQSAGGSRPVSRPSTTHAMVVPNPDPNGALVLQLPDSSREHLGSTQARAHDNFLPRQQRSKSVTEPCPMLSIASTWQPAEDLMLVCGSPMTPCGLHNGRAVPRPSTTSSPTRRAHGSIPLATGRLHKSRPCAGALPVLLGGAPRMEGHLDHDTPMLGAARSSVSYLPTLVRPLSRAAGDVAKLCDAFGEDFQPMTFKRIA